MSEQPILEDGDSEPNEAFTSCDCCGSLRWWDELETGDDGESWICATCASGSVLVGKGPEDTP